MDGLFTLDSTGGTVAFALIRILGIAGGIAIGRSFAGSWKQMTLMPFAIILMAAAVQFVLYAILQIDILSMPNFTVALVLVGLAAAYGFRAKRTEQMCRQYPWLFGRAGPVSWTHRP